VHFAGLQTAEEFTFELFCGTPEMSDVLPNSVSLNLVKQDRLATGVVELKFNLKFSPFRTMK
jgi:hypothetical protein